MRLGVWGVICEANRQTNSSKVPLMAFLLALNADAPDAKSYFNMDIPSLACILNNTKILRHALRAAQNDDTGVTFNLHGIFNSYLSKRKLLLPLRDLRIDHPYQLSPMHSQLEPFVSGFVPTYPLASSSPLEPSVCGLISICHHPFHLHQNPHIPFPSPCSL